MCFSFHTSLLCGKDFSLEGVRHEAEEVVYLGEGRGSRGTTTAVAGGMSDRKSNKLKVAYTNVDGIISSMLEIKDYLSMY